MCTGMISTRSGKCRPKSDFLSIQSQQPRNGQSVKTSIIAILAFATTLTAFGQTASNFTAAVSPDINATKCYVQVGKTIFDFSVVDNEKETLYKMRDVVLKELVKVREQMVYLIKELKARKYTDPDYDSKNKVWEKKHAIAQINSENVDKKMSILMARRTQFRRQSGKYWVDGEVLQVMSDGLLVKCVEDDEKTLTGYKDLVFVEDYPLQKTLVDGNSIRSWGIPSGRYQYTNTMGAQKTIPKFTAGNKLTHPVPPEQVQSLPR